MSTVARYLLVSCLSLCAIPSAARAAGGPLTQVQRAKAKQSARQQLRQSPYYTSSRRPSVRMSFTPAGANAVDVKAELVATWRGRREVVETKTGRLKLQKDGSWRFPQRGASPTALVSPKAPLQSVRAHSDTFVSQAAVLARTSTSTTVVSYHADDRTIRLSSVGRQGDLLDQRKVTAPILRAAQRAHGRGWAYPTGLAKNGRSAQVDVYSNPAAGRATVRTAYRVSLSTESAPTGVQRGARTFIGR